MSKRTYIIAHDLGTTGDKATLFADDGTLLTSAFSAYPTLSPQPGWFEQDPNDWWRAVISSTRELLAKAEVASGDLAAVGFSGHMMGCLPVGSDGTPLANSMTHADTRSAPEATAIAERVGDRRYYEITGNPADSHYPAPKFLWLKQNAPEVYEKTKWFLQSKDWVAGRLTGRFGVTDYSDASLYGLFDMRAKGWSDGVIHACGLDADTLPEIVPSSTVIGRVTSEAARATGLPEGLPVVIGGGDGACAAVGAGAVRVGDAYNYIGSTSWIASITDRPVFDPQSRLFVLCNLDGESYSLIGTVQAAGTSVEWAADTIGRPETERAATDGSNRFGLLDELAMTAPPGSCGLVFLPYLQGERTPIWNPNARGVFFGLGTEHGREHMMRAVLEGVGYALRGVVDTIEENGVRVDELKLIGGGASSPFWRSILADIFGRPVIASANPKEATSYGAAIAAGIGVGMFEDYSVVERFLKQGERVQPGSDAELYSRSYALFRSLYPALKDGFQRLSEFR